MSCIDLLLVPTLILCLPTVSSYAVPTITTKEPITDQFLSDDLNTLIVYQLFTRKNPKERQTLILNDLPSLSGSNFNPNLPTKIYGIGWDNDGSIANATRDEYLIRMACNFIVIDWQALQLQPNNNFFIGRTVRTASNHTAAFIDFLIDTTGAAISLFHLIGHSAGAHLCGGAGALVTSGRIPRITGLDPGIMPFAGNDTLLDMTDAEFVDIIHTNGGSVLNGEIAIYDPIGHVDFYVNGGRKQPGCSDVEFSCCNHCRAVDLFAESITTNVGFVSLKCDSYENYINDTCYGNEKQLMGEFVSFCARGIFYVQTNGEAPWARG